MIDEKKKTRDIESCHLDVTVYFQDCKEDVETTAIGFGKHPSNSALYLHTTSV